MAVSSTRAFVFTDMVDSTALASRIGDVRADAVRHAHHQATADAVVECGGQVVKDTGDGIMAAFGSAVAAMDAAVGAQRAVARLNQVGAVESGGSVVIRAGVSIGEAVEEDGDWFGMPVVEAARLCAAAATGQVLVSDAVRLMAGSRARFPLRGVGPLPLKGLPEPLTAFEVVWEELVVRLFGDAEVRVGYDRVKAFDSPRLQSLLACLVLGRDRPLSRQKLAFTFWPDSSEGQARTNLRQALHHLRLALPDADRYLRLDSQTVQWLAEAPADVDVVRFEGYARSGLENGDEEGLARAADLYRGDLLAGCYDDWITPERERLRISARAVLRSLLEHACRRGAWQEAVGVGDRLLRLDALDESTYRRLMQVHAAAGDRARAVHVYHQCVSVLDRELGVRPDPETVEMYERVMAEGSDRAGGGDVTAEAVVASSPMVGRDDELDRLIGTWRQIQGGRPRFVVVVGEPGIGKSRLVEEFRLWCGREGVATVGARAYEAEGAVPYGPIVEVLRSEVVGSSLGRLDPVWRRELGRVLPELPPITDPTSSDAPGAGADRRRLFEAIARGLVSPARPLVLAVDDVHWCDPDTLDLLEFTVHFAAQTASSLLVVATAREEELASQARLRSLLARLHALDVVVELPLRRLGRADAAAVVNGLLGADATEVSVERLVTDAEGNPLFLVEMARSGVTGQSPGGPDEVRLPPRVQAVIEARLDQLSHAAREVASVAAVVGRAFTIDVIGRVVADDDDAVAAVDELWRRGIVRERGADRYDFTHDKIREVAYLTIGPARRRRVHAAVAAALQADVNGAVEAAQIASHLERAGQADAAVAYYRHAVASAAHVFAHQEVISSCRRALQLLAGRPPGPERDDVELGFLVPLGVALMAGPGITDADRSVYERARVLRAQRGLVPEPSTLRLSANAAISRRDYHEARHFGQLLLERGSRDDDAVLVTEGHYLLGVTSFWLGELRTARYHLTEALASNRPEHTPVHLEHYGQDPRAVCLVRLGLTQFHLGEHAAAARLCEEGLAAAATGHAYTEAYARTFAAWYSAESGAAERATMVVDDMPAGSTTNVTFTIARAMFAGWAHTARGDPEKGIPLLEAARHDAHHGQPMFEPYALLMLAHAQALAGDPAAGLAAAIAARAIAADEMPFHAPEASRLNGELLLATGGNATDAIAHLEHAADTAARQGSIIYELRARTSLLRALRRHHSTAVAAEEQALREACDRLPTDVAIAELAAARQELTRSD